MAITPHIYNTHNHLLVLLNTQLVLTVTGTSCRFGEESGSNGLHICRIASLAYLRVLRGVEYGESG